ncbi:MAG: LexA family protein [Gemmatimonadota bacterium]
MQALTTLERDVLDYLVEYVRRHTYQPSVREIGAEFGIKSTKTVSELLQSLADKGWIERDSSRSRGVRLLGLDLGLDVVSVPHIDVHLSEPLAEPLDSLALDRRIAGPAASFLVSMVGDSMGQEGIRDGDLLLVEPVPEQELIDGDLVLCRLESDTCVRRFRHQDGAAILDPGRVDRAPALLDRGGDDEILGRITAVVRRLRTDSPMGRTAPAPSDEGVAAG